MTAKKVWPGKKAFYILWNPDSEKPSKVTFPTIEAAERVGRTMALKYEGDGFVVMKSVRRIEVPPPPRLKVTEYE